MYAETQAPDGMAVRETFSTVESGASGLAVHRRAGERARARCQAASPRPETRPIGEEFTGPVLLEGGGSAQFIAETLLPLVAARRGARLGQSAHGAGRRRGHAISVAHGTARDGGLVFGQRHAVAETVQRAAGGRRVRGGRRRRAREGRDAGGQGPARHAPDQPHAAEEFPAVERARPRQRRVGGRVPARERSGDSASAS